MSLNRIQKLLFSEYCEFEDMVLIESPFAETTRDGKGLRQVQIGLTPTKLVFATDVLRPAKESIAWCLQDVDPDIETFELISVYPVESVNLSIFHRRKRQALKAHFCNNRVYYFELGGFEKKNMFWNLWCERVKFLSPNETRSSRSETSVGSSTSNSTLYLLKANTIFPSNGAPQLWCTFDKANSIEMRNKWTERDLFLGEKEILPPLPIETLYKTDLKKFDEDRKYFSTSESVFQEIPGLKASRNIMVMATEILERWENCCSKKNKYRHRRRYGFAPQPHFLFGLGPWNVHSGERFSIQVKRAVSSVQIQRQPNESSLRLPISKRQLTSWVSFDTLINQPKSSNTILVNASLNGNSRPPKLFWTPEYWYRPRTARSAYQELQTHLNKIKTYHHEKRHKSSKRSIFSRKPRKDKEKPLIQKEQVLHYLKRVLHLRIPLSISDFDSTTIAYQLTIIDRDLFLRITKLELGIIVWQQTSKNTPNIGAIVAFSHRISCLVASEVIKEQDVKVRARLIARFITIADKCNKIYNFQSCKSVLCGLQSPGIFRLRVTWSYVRHKHPTKYQLFENLCRIYRDPRLPNFRKAFFKAAKNTPYLPYIGDILYHLIDKIPKNGSDYVEESVKEEDYYPLSQIQTISNLQTQKSYSPNSSLPSIVRRILSAFRIWQTPESQISIKKHKIPDIDIINETKKFYDLAIVNYEDNREFRFNEMCDLLEVFQKSAENYALNENEMANEYLLKARYWEDRDNFCQSFELEE